MGGSRWLVGLIVTLGVVIGSGAGATAQSPSPSLSPVPTAAPTTSSSPAPSAAAEPEHPPFAQELIERALAAGSIDYPTSLLYRAYALFGDERLPDEFLGAGSVGDDGGLPGEVTLSTDSLPPAIANDLEPFFLRPTDPSSLFHQGAEGLGSVSLAQTDEGTDLTPEASAECTGGWLGLPSTLEGVTLKVWAACDGSEQADASSVLAYAESLWTPMTTLMGVPRPDNGSFAAGGDGAIDIYLLPPGGRARNQGISATAFAVAVSTDREGGRASGFILVPRAAIHVTRFRLSLAHELFHVLQYAHNADIVHRPTGDLDAAGNTIHEEYWFVEASATWAGTYFDRPDSADYHDERFPWFQHTFAGVPLQRASPQLHTYADYIWPFFMEQEVDAGAVAAVWTGLEGVARGDWDTADGVIDGVLSFKDHFRDFAVRNVDQKLPGDPISPMYQDLDKVPLDIKPRLQTVDLAAQARSAKPIRIPVSIPSLTANYLRLRPDKDVRQLTVEFDELEPGDALDVDALVKVKAQDAWKRDRLAHGDKLHYCFHKPDEDIDRLVLVLSDHEYDIHTTITGDITVKALDVPCGEYSVSGSYEVIMKAGTGATWNTFRFDGEFSLTDSGTTNEPSKPSDAPDGAGRYTGSAGQFEPGQTECAPHSSLPIDAEFDIVATVEDNHLSIWIVPKPPANDPLLDVFNTRFDLTQFGAKHLVVPLDGGTFRWGGGTLPMKVECDGIEPGSGGRFTVVKTSDE